MENDKFHAEVKEQKKVKTYSNSKLWLYENCPEAYKIKYIDKKFPDLPKSIHAFLGSMAHDSLEWLYLEVQKGRTPSLDEFIEKYLEKWHGEFSEDLRITRGNKEEFFNKGIKFLVDYYEKHKPFEENTIETEKQILFDLEESGEYRIIGYVDRLVLNEDGEYEVHDYKTNSFMKRQAEVDKDRQLAFYHMGIKKLFGEEVKVKLIWHFLAYNRTIYSFRNDEQLERLRQETLELIKKIENTTEWPACGKQFCDWCSYKKMQGLDRFLS